MIKIQLTQTQRIVCDWCGEPATAGWQETIERARTAALEAGFHLNSWMEGQCVRESQLCDGCYKKRRRQP